MSAICRQRFFSEHQRQWSGPVPDGPVHGLQWRSGHTHPLRHQHRLPHDPQRRRKWEISWGCDSISRMVFAFQKLQFFWVWFGIIVGIIFFPYRIHAIHLQLPGQLAPLKSGMSKWAKLSVMPGGGLMMAACSGLQGPQGQSTPTTTKVKSKIVKIVTSNWLFCRGYSLVQSAVFQLH